MQDIQTVAKETLNRKLTPDEIKSILDPISENIPWYDTISGLIRENIEASAEAKNI